MRDFLPAEVRKRNYVINIIKDVYESYGFEPLETPAVENLETLMGKYGEEGNQLIFRILKRGEKLDEALASENPHSAFCNPQLADLALRYDLTVPLARVVANNKNDLPKFFKRYQIQPVWRADRPARGRFREFYQCDVDCIGSNSMIVEAEQIEAVCEILTKLGFKNFNIRANHRLLLDAMMVNATIAKEKRSSALVALDKLDKIGQEGVRDELAKLDIQIESIDTLLYLTTNKNFFAVGKPVPYVPSSDRFTENQETLRHVRSYFKDFPAESEQNNAANLALHSLENIVDLTASLPSRNRLKIDPSLARGLSYYTGTIMEIVLTDGDFRGSIGGGGRYDGLIGMFGKEQIPACGFSLGLERILVVMDELGMFPPEIAESTPADVMVTIWSEETVAESLKLASELRASGLRVILYPEADKLGKQLKYADTIKVPYVCILGEGEVTVKNMKTGEQKTVGRTDVARSVPLA